MANVATLTAKMVMDVSGFSSGANKAITDLSKLKVGIGHLTVGMAAGAAGGLAMAGAMSALHTAAAGVRAVLHGITSEVQHGFGLAIAAEAAQTQFEVLLDSADKAKKLMEDINSFAQATPFSVTGARESVQKLLGAGVDEERLLPTLRMLGEISGGNTEKLGLMAHTYGEVMSKGKLLASELNQLSSAGINARTALADELHIEVKDLAKAMEAGSVTAIDFHNALHELSVGKFAGSLEKGAKTIEGSLNRLKEVRDSFSRDVALGISEKWGLTATADDIANLAEGFKALTPVVVAAFADMGDAMFTFIDDMRTIGALMPDPATAAAGGPMAFFGNVAGRFANAAFDPSVIVGIDTKRDFRNAATAIKGIGASLPKEELPESKRMEKSTFTDLGKAMGSGLAADFGKAFMGIGSTLGTMGAGAAGGFRNMAKNFLTPDERPEQRATSALQAGSSEAFSAIIAAMTGRDKNTDAKRTAKAAEAAEKLLTDAVRFLRKMADEGGDVINAFGG